MKKLFLLFSVLINCHCESWPDRKYPLMIKNESYHSLGVYFALGGKNGTLFPDTVLPEKNNYVIKNIKPGANYYYDSGLKWEKIFEEIPSDTMSVYFFHSDTLEKYNWEIIRDEHKIIKRIDYSLEDLKALNYTIIYK